MGTSYFDIYKANRLIKNDPRLKNLDDCELNTIRFGYLRFAISYFIYDCRKDLSLRIDPSVFSYNFSTDGSDSQFLLIPSPPDDSMFVVYLNDEIVPYSYDLSTHIITINNIEAGSVKIKSYTYGSFDEILDDREITILAEGMNVPFLEETKNDENMLKYIVSGKSLRFFSQANHMTASKDVVNSQAYNTVDGLISEYSYKGSADNYKGLSGRGGING